LHEADATVSRGTCLATRRSFPSGAARRGRLRPKEARGNVIDYEILLLFDAELPRSGRRDRHAHARARRARRRHLREPRRLGTPPARLRDRPQGRGHYHL
jgi:hypothetical protein